MLKPSHVAVLPQKRHEVERTTNSLYHARCCAPRRTLQQGLAECMHCMGPTATVQCSHYVHTHTHQLQPVARSPRSPL